MQHANWQLYPVRSWQHTCSLRHLLQGFARNERLVLPWGPSSWLFLSRRHDMWWKNKRNMKVELWFFFFFTRMGERKVGVWLFTKFHEIKPCLCFYCFPFLHSLVSYQWEKLFKDSLGSFGLVGGSKLGESITKKQTKNSPKISSHGVTGPV